MESELIAIGAGQMPLDAHIAAVRPERQTQVLVSQAAERLPG